MFAARRKNALEWNGQGIPFPGLGDDVGLPAWPAKYILSQELITLGRSRRGTRDFKTPPRAGTTSGACPGRPGSPHGGVTGEPWIMSDKLMRSERWHGRTSLTAGPIFDGTRKPLRTWCMAMWFGPRPKNGGSAFGPQRVLGRGSYATAWTWLPKRRRAMVRPGRDGGNVEMDATYAGGPEKGKWGRETGTKAIVAVAAEENGKGIGRIRLRRVKDVSAASLLPFVQGAVFRAPWRRGRPSIPMAGAALPG